MPPHRVPLESVRVASPCDIMWEEMTGTGRVRFCGHCRRNVYNVSAMSRREAEEQILEREGRLCVRFYRRADGTVLTEDCPVGLRAVRRRVALIVGGVAAAFLAMAAWGAAFFGLVLVRDSFPKLPPFQVVPSRPPGVVMGEMCPPVPPDPLEQPPVDPEPALPLQPVPPLPN